MTARLAKVRVLEFGVGFPPRAKSLGRGGVSAEDASSYRLRRAEAIEEAQGDPERLEAILESPEEPPGTLYTLNWLPIGGFVKLEDEDGGDSGDPRSFGRARLPVKLVILAAGVVMNLLLAFAIFTLIAWFATPYIGLRFESVEPGSPAAAAGIVAGDAIISVNGERYDFFSPYDGTSIVDGLRSHAGETVVIGLVHEDGSREEVTHDPPDTGGDRRRQGRPRDQGWQAGLRTAVPAGVHRPAAGAGGVHRCRGDVPLVRPDPRVTGQPRGIGRGRPDRAAAGFGAGGHRHGAGHGVLATAAPS